MKVNVLDEILFWFFMALSLFLIFWYIFGNSPTSEEIILPILTGYLIKISIDLKGVKVLLQHHMQTTKEEFRVVRWDIRDLRQDLVHRKNDLETLKTKFQVHRKGHS